MSNSGISQIHIAVWLQLYCQDDVSFCAAICHNELFNSPHCLTMSELWRWRRFDNFLQGALANLGVIWAVCEMGWGYLKLEEIDNFDRSTRLLLTCFREFDRMNLFYSL